jgi:hypothetical protein
MFDFKLGARGALAIFGGFLIVGAIFSSWDIASRILVGVIGAALIFIALKF